MLLCLVSSRRGGSSDSLSGPLGSVVAQKAYQPVGPTRRCSRIIPAPAGTTHVIQKHFFGALACGGGPGLVGPGPLRGPRRVRDLSPNPDIPKFLYKRRGSGKGVAEAGARGASKPDKRGCAEPNVLFPPQTRAGGGRFAGGVPGHTRFRHVNPGWGVAGNEAGVSGKQRQAMGWSRPKNPAGEDRRTVGARNHGLAGKPSFARARGPKPGIGATQPEFRTHFSPPEAWAKKNGRHQGLSPRRAGGPGKKKLRGPQGAKHFDGGTRGSVPTGRFEAG